MKNAIKWSSIALAVAMGSGLVVSQASAAVQNNGNALEYASTKLQNDREVVLAAIQDSSMAFIYASFMLRADKKIVLELLKGAFPYGDLNERIYDHIPEFLRKDSEVDEAWKSKNPTPWPNRTL